MAGQHYANQGKLKDRMNTHQTEKRVERIEARKTVAQQLSIEHARTRGIAVASYSVLRRGFFGRLKWLLLGR